MCSFLTGLALAVAGGSALREDVRPCGTLAPRSARDAAIRLTPAACFARFGKSAVENRAGIPIIIGREYNSCVWRELYLNAVIVSVAHGQDNGVVATERADGHEYGRQ
jgi:hypothetical protein